MSINPYILLGIGSAFALLYAYVIIFGWAATRRNRRVIQQARAITEVPVWILDESLKNVPVNIKTVSLSNNKFGDSDGTPIDVASYHPFVAIGRSAEYPNIQNGDLVLKDAAGNVKYVFSVPDIRDYR